MDGVGRKHSRKRDAILKVIRSTSSHPSAQWVYEQLKPAIPGLSLGTVYRNISLFREEGAVISVGVVQGEERFDGQVRPHPHFVCSCCGKIIDIPPVRDETLGKIAEMELQQGESALDLHIDHRKTVFYGLCEDCYRETGDLATGA
jgi:Fur family peroxide stress response transcriptional regulator